MMIMFQATCFVICLAFVNGRRIDREQSHVQNTLMSNEKDHQYRMEGQKIEKEKIFSTMHDLVKNLLHDNDDLRCLMCQFDFLLRKCERLTSLQENQSIPDQNNKQETGYDAQPETNENLKPITDQNKQPDSGNNLESVKDQHINPIASQNNHPEINHNLQQETVQNLRPKINHTTQPETDQTLRAIKDNNTQPEMDQNTQPRTHRNTPPEMDQNIQPITNHSSQSKTDQIIQPLTNHSTKPEMDQNIQPITDYITRREPDHDLKFTTDQRKQVETDHKDQPVKDLQSTTGHPLKHAEFYNKKSKLDQDHYLPVDEYDMGDEVSGAKYMGPGDLLCQMCSSVITSPEKQKCETQFCDY